MLSSIYGDDIVRQRLDEAMAADVVLRAGRLDPAGPAPAPAEPAAGEAPRTERAARLVRCFGVVVALLPWPAGDERARP